MLMILAAALFARPFDLHERGRDVDYRYRWTAEASAIPALAGRFRADLAKTKMSTAKNARNDRASAAQGGYPFRQHSFDRQWRFAGQSRRLSSFVGALSADTGGAHPNHGSTALLWDRSTSKEVKFAALFARAGSRDALLKSSWCKALDRERVKKLGGVQPGSMFEKCPGLDELSIVPSDSNGDRYFDHLVLTADAYVAGSYAEGDYVITLPVTRAFIAALRPAYRDSFR